MLDPSQIDVTCPLCGVQTRLNLVRRHGLRNHAELSASEFEASLMKAMEKGELKFDTKRVPRSIDMNTATSVLRRHVYGGNVAVPFNGGAFESGKRR